MILVDFIDTSDIRGARITVQCDRIARTPAGSTIIIDPSHIYGAVTQRSAAANEYAHILAFAHQKFIGLDSIAFSSDWVCSSVRGA